MQFFLFSPRQVCFCLFLSILPGLFLPCFSQQANDEAASRMARKSGSSVATTWMKNKK